MRKLLLLTVTILASFTVFSQDFSNKGKDFWTGYGYHQVMTTGNQQQMVLYFATDQVTNITITIPGLGYTQTLTSPAGNNVLTSAAIPKINPQDARLLNTQGTFDKGIHITSDKPVVAYAHIYNSNVSGATILFPTNTLGKEYYSVNFKNISNTSDANCWFYVVAVDTGTTVVEITPSANTVGAWIAGTTYTVTLTQGQIYNVPGTFTNGGAVTQGVDLTGSKIKSIAGANGECKRVAVFSGSGRIAISCNNTAPSSDNYMVQAFPKTAWGKKYLTVPAAGNQSNNIYRVCVTDPTTVVNIDGVVGGYPLQNNFYYEIPSSNQPHVITADKPILVAQYFPSQGACGNGTPGDPEVIYLSAVEQNINKVLWNATPNFNISAHYFNVVIPNSGTAISSFRLDGAIPVGSFTPHPQDPNYVYLKQSVSAGPHVIQSDSGFNAIAYGFGTTESYGYNAGTNIRDLYNFLTPINPLSISSDPVACTGTPFYFSVTFPFQPTSLYWDFHGYFANVNDLAPVFDSTYFIGTRQVWRYKLSTPYTYSPANSNPGYPVTITAGTTSAEGCGNSFERDFDLAVYDPTPATIGWIHNGCVTDSVSFKDSSNYVSPLYSYKWWWNFGDGTTDSVKNPRHKYLAPGTYTVRFAMISNVGCISDTAQRTITVTNIPVADFSNSIPVCAGLPVSFTDLSSASQPGFLTVWNWNFGDPGSGANNTSVLQTPPPHTYLAWGNKTVSLLVKTNSGCPSLTTTKTVYVNPIPFVDFTMPPGVCLPGDSAHFFDASTIADGTQNGFSYSWNFGDPPSAPNNTSALKNPAHYYNNGGPFSITLQVTSAAGCVHDTVKVLSNVYPQADGAFTAPAPVCFGTNMTFVSSSTAPAGSAIVSYKWDFGDGSAIVTASSATIIHSYIAGTFTVKHWIVTDKGCNSDTAINQVTVYVVPAISSAVPTNPTTCLGNEGFIILNGLLAGQSYTVNYDKNGTPQPVLTLVASASGQVVIPNLTAGSYSNINCTANGCTSSNAPTQTLTDPAPPTAPTPSSNGPICAGSTLNLFATAVAGASGYNWTGPNGFTSPLQNPSIAAATTAATGVYNVTVTVNNCTSALSSALNVVVNDLPVISSVVPTNPSTCAGTDGFITLNGLTAGQTYTVNYSKNGTPQPALNLTANASGQVVIPNLSSGTYTNINCSANNCTSTNAPAQVLSDPSAPAPPTTGSNSPICAGATLNLTASAVTNATYNWSGPNGFTAAVQNPSIVAATTAASGAYIVTVTVNNCTSASSIPLNVVVNVTPAISSAVPTNPTTCLGNEGFITLNGLLAGQSYTVNYTKNGTPQPVLTLVANASGQLVIPNLTAGSYTNINCTANGCTSPDAPTQTLTDPAPPAAPTPSSNGPICAGSTLNLFATTVAAATAYNWTGPNGFTSALQNPSIAAATTAATGIYNVTVTVNNCTSSLSTALNVVVNDMPVISSVTPVNPSTCAGSDGTITLNGLIAGQTYTVNYNKNAVAQTPLLLTANASGSVTITGLTAGTYSNINCTANNCTSANAPTQTLSDPSAPAAPTASSNSPVCAGFALNLTAGAVTNATYAWSGPNGFTSALQNPSIPAATVAATGNYNVTVTVSNCTSAATIIPVVINALPTANFNFTAPSCETRTISFSDVSLANSGTLNGWTWDFGDPGSGANNTSSIQNPTHSFAATGTYAVTLSVTNSNGCVSTVFSRNVVINARPLAGFILPEVCLSDTYAQFTDTSKIATGTITGWEWNFGDPVSGALNTSTLQNPQHSYTAVGSYNVRLIVTSNNGCRDTITQVLFVNGSFPVADFTVANPTTLCANDSVSITNTSTVFPGVITKIEIYWDNVNFPLVLQTDNAPAPGKVYKHLYPNFQSPLTKNFTIRFRAYSGGVCVNDKISVITVNAAPKVQFNNIPNACLDAAPYQITQATEIGGVPGSAVFSGPGVSASGIFNPASVGPGTYTIRYTYTSSAGGCVDSASKQITVLAAPVADFSVSAPVCETKAITFTDASATPVGTLTTWTWNFADGTPLDVRNSNAPFTHVFAAAGTYNVTLRVTTSDGCISIAKQIAVIVKPQPKPNFTVPASVCLPNAVVNFTNTSSIADASAMTYSWNFGDIGSGSNTSAAANPSHTYSAVGPYNVNLQVSSVAGCVHDTTIVIDMIHPQPKADFSINKPGICIGENVTFTDLSDGKDGTVNQWSWSLGDGGVRTTQNVTYTYGTANTFNVSLFIVNSQGCNSDTVTKQFTVHPYPVVNAGPDRVVLEGGSVILQPIVTGNDLQYLWTPNLYMNDNRSGAPTVSNVLADITYTLTVTARGACTASDMVFVKLLKAPKIPNTFTPNGDGINDVWAIDYLNTYPDNRVQVFTRTGQLVFESRGYGTPWNGKLNGKALPFDTYYYIIEPNNGRKPMTGYVTIVR